MNTEKLLKEFITENFLFENSNCLNNEINLFEKGIIDSTGIIELICFIEVTFNISIKDEELVMENFLNINNIKEFIHKKTSAEAG